MIQYKKNKYGAIKTIYNKHKYDSRKEAEYAELLDGLLKTKKIKAWNRQTRFKLPDLNWFSKKTHRFWYAVDFVVTTNDNCKHLVEVKGQLTPANKIKYAYFKYIYNCELHIVRTTGLDKMNTYWLDCKECSTTVPEIGVKHV